MDSKDSQQPKPTNYQLSSLATDTPNESTNTLSPLLSSALVVNKPPALTLPAKIPNSYKCGITDQIMFRPVTIKETKHTYEQDELERWFSTHNTDPKTGLPLKDKSFDENFSMRQVIEEFISEYPDLWLTDEIYFSKSVFQQAIVALKAGDNSLLDRLLVQDPRFVLQKIENASDEETLLHAACKGTKLNILEVVLNRLGKRLEQLVKIYGRKAFVSLAIEHQQLPGAKRITMALGWENKDYQEFLWEMIPSASATVLSICIELAGTNCVSPSGEPLLHRLVACDRLEVALNTINKGAPLDKADSEGNTILHLAAAKDLPEIIQSVIERCSIDQALLSNPLTLKINKDKCTAIEIAQLANSTKALALLVAATPSDQLFKLLAENRSVKEIQKLSPILHWEANFYLRHAYLAIKEFNINRFQLCLELGVPADSKYEQRPLLHWIADTNILAVMFYFLHKELQVNAMDEQGNTAMHVVAKYGNVEMIKLLLDKGATCLRLNHQNILPIQIAAQHDHKDAVIALAGDQTELFRLLCQHHGIDQIKPIATRLDWDNNFFLKQIYSVLASNNLNQFKVCLALGVSVNSICPPNERSVQSPGSLPTPKTSPSDKKPLVHLACALGSLAMIQCLLEQNVSLDAEDETKQTALHIAAYRGDVDIIDALILHHADPLAKSCGKLPILIAIENNQDLAVKRLARAVDALTLFNQLNEQEAKQLGPHLNWDTNFYMQCALSYAKKGDREGLAKCLALGVHRNTKDESHSTLMHYAAQFGSLDCVKFLIEHKAELNNKNKTGDTPLHFAAERGHFPVIELLLDNGANGKALNLSNQTPADVARDAWHDDVATKIENKRRALKLAPILQPLQETTRQQEQFLQRLHRKMLFLNSMTQLTLRARPLFISTRHPTFSFLPLPIYILAIIDQEKVITQNKADVLEIWDIDSGKRTHTFFGLASVLKSYKSLLAFSFKGIASEFGSYLWLAVSALTRLAKLPVEIQKFLFSNDIPEWLEEGDKIVNINLHNPSLTSVQFLFQAAKNQNELIKALAIQAIKKLTNLSPAIKEYFVQQTKESNKIDEVVKIGLYELLMHMNTQEKSEEALRLVNSNNNVESIKLPNPTVETIKLLLQETKIDRPYHVVAIKILTNLQDLSAEVIHLLIEKIIECSSQDALRRALISAISYKPLINPPAKLVQILLAEPEEIYSGRYGSDYYGASQPIKERNPAYGCARAVIANIQSPSAEVVQLLPVSSTIKSAEYIQQLLTTNRTSEIRDAVEKIKDLVSPPIEIISKLIISAKQYSSYTASGLFDRSVASNILKENKWSKLSVEVIKQFIAAMDFSGYSYNAYSNQTQNEINREYNNYVISLLKTRMIPPEVMVELLDTAARTPTYDSERYKISSFIDIITNNQWSNLSVQIMDYLLKIAIDTKHSLNASIIKALSQLKDLSIEAIELFYKSVKSSNDQAFRQAFLSALNNTTLSNPSQDIAKFLLQTMRENDTQLAPLAHIVFSKIINPSNAVQLLLVSAAIDFNCWTTSTIAVLVNSSNIANHEKLLIEASKDKNKEIQNQAFHALANLTHCSVDGITVIVNAAKYCNAEAIQALGNLKAPSAEVLRCLVDLAESTNTASDIHQFVCEALRKLSSFLKGDLECVHKLIKISMTADNTHSTYSESYRLSQQLQVTKYLAAQILLDYSLSLHEVVGEQFLSVFEAIDHLNLNDISTIKLPEQTAPKLTN